MTQPRKQNYKMLRLASSLLRVRVGLHKYSGFSSTVDSPADGRFIYDPDNLITKSDKYFDDKEIGQCCEKAYHATELTLINFVEQLEKRFGVKIAEKGKESWNHYMLNRLVTKLAEHFMTKEQAELFCTRWNTATNFHILGWKQNSLSVEFVEQNRQYVKNFIADLKALEKTATAEMATLLADKLFFNPKLAATQLKQICADYSNSKALTDLEKKKFVSKAAECLGIRSTRQKEHKDEMFEEMTPKEMVILREIFPVLDSIMTVKPNSKQRETETDMK